MAFPAVAVDTGSAAKVGAAKDRLATEVKDGHLTQDQADKRMTELPGRIKAMVEHTGAMRGPGGPGQK